jgi:hypothetical protein
MSVLVDSFLVASPVNPRLYRKLLQTLRLSLVAGNQRGGLGMDPAHLVTLTESVAMALNTEAHGANETLFKDDLDLLYAVLDIVAQPLRMSETGAGAVEVSSLRRAVLKALTRPLGGMPAPARALLEWISDPPAHSDETRRSRGRLRVAISELLSDILGKEDADAAPRLCWTYVLTS